MASGFKLLIRPSGIECFCDEGESILASLEALPESCRGGVRVGCRGGGCGMCRIRVTSGSYRTGKMSVRHISEKCISGGVVLACRTYPTSDLEIEQF